VNLRLGLAFAPTSFFPNIELNDILEREFQISYALQIPFDFNHKEYYEFVWFFERLVQERKAENEAHKKAEGRTSLTNLGAPNMNMNMNMSGKNGR